ncbi:6-phosphogluconolactonase [Thiobacter aerophilum]|uniref:6-phosphogluconolactonase n=1 Tax=Thiobacter aerophilum TaxID=3121275 RepID=A0ABV0EEN2_9BURK
MQTRWHVLKDAATVAAEARRRLLAAADAAIRGRGAFHLVLAGGATPRLLYTSLVDARADWSRWHIWFGDERVLPAAHPERNSVMARMAWLDHVPIPPAQIHVIPTERGLHAAVEAYRRALAGMGEFDLVLLGLGEDGHTASLFPERDWGEGPAAADVLAIEDAPKPPPARVSLSAARLSRARGVWFLVTGAAKREAVARWRRGESIPAAAIRPATGVDVFLDAAAAGETFGP